MTIEAKNVVPPFSAQHLEAICRVLADTDTGLTGSEIGCLLQDGRIVETDPTLTKWKRLFNAFVGFQNEHQAGNCVVVFITRSMNPASYTDRPDAFRFRRDKLNAVLAFCGLQLREDGKVKREDKAPTIDQALERAIRLRAALIQRAVHADVLKFCTAELLDKNYFHAVFEAIKSITAKLRQLTGSTIDGADLVHHACRRDKEHGRLQYMHSGLGSRHRALVVDDVVAKFEELRDAINAFLGHVFIELNTPLEDDDTEHSAESSAVAFINAR